MARHCEFIFEEQPEPCRPLPSVKFLACGQSTRRRLFGFGTSQSQKRTARLPGSATNFGLTLVFRTLILSVQVGIARAFSPFVSKTACTGLVFLSFVLLMDVSF